MPDSRVSPERTPLLRLDDVGVRYGGTVALAGVSFEIARGGLFGLIGPNGAGKTTLIEAVSGFLPHATGDVVFDGEPLGGLRPDQRSARGLVRTFQSLELFEDLTVRENLFVAAEPRGLAASLLDLVRPGKRAADSDRVQRALEVMEITEHADRLPDQLSNGQRKLVAVGRAIAADAKLIMLDEPAAGLDSEESRVLGSRFRGLVDSGVSMLLVDHDMGLVLGICDRVHVLDFGQTIAEGTPEEIRRSPAVVRAYLGEDQSEVPRDVGWTERSPA
jgi:branched-chain amino acid transport system ATP-binding protein